MGFKGMFTDLNYRYSWPTGGYGLIRLVDMGFKGMFTYLNYRYTGLTGGSGFNQIEMQMKVDDTHIGQSAENQKISDI